MSFAGAQRALARQFARECESLGLVVFFDENVTEEMWGRDFITEFRRVYGGKLARYVVPFLSVEYFDSGYPMDEFYAAIAYAIKRGDDPYVLPITVGDVEIPEELLRSSIGYLRSENYSVEQLAQIAAKRVSGSGDAMPTPAPTPIAAVQLPKVAPTDFSQFGTLESGLATLSEHFRRAESSLAPFGYSCHVSTGGSSLEVRVESHGRQVYGLKVQLQDWLGSDRLTMSHGWPRPSGGAINAWATAEWDAEAGEGRFRFSHFSRTTPDRLLSADELFDVLWQNVIDFIEQTQGRRA
ncbi:toll/interleukin-1 receptor domain-containing protein [Amycolatopsis rubida]|uniref:Toll/interleukin-1 receptor domain-containing protein n=1 Tax=Amycolatopsis rubida TaxID=112413 RepID=A0ABX0C3S8_9PSEU|nr:toll/interleukin-1 receptor domain-containing protein [Amycolatopsis sp. M39]MYW97445.1 TIR domain-containing protein [Amycolatopsis rubida]NEC62430.1 toll/interleukin-1 receptor domain-containing protein [Amycolatopsis rubida]OAP21307.1 hypothetical protein A4R44_07825 [Amycolatopsis sp. M39]